MFNKKFIVLVFSLFLTAFSCAKEIAGIDPPSEKLFFPTGILFDEGSKTLFVTNGNSDLKYNGSTLMALDMTNISSKVSEPLNSSSCKVDPQNRGEFLCDVESDMILASVRLGSYAGDIVKFPAPEGSDIAYRLMVSVRGDPSLTYIDVYTSSDGKVSCLDCGAGCGNTKTARCTSSHKLSSSDGLMSDPFLLTYDPENNYIFSTHLSTGEITMVDVLMDPPVISSVLSGVLTNTGSGTGSYQMINNSGEFFVSNALAPEVKRFVYEYSPNDASWFLVPAGTYYFQTPYGPMETGSEVRGLALSNDKKRLYAAVRTPAMLLTLDMTDDETGKPSLDLIRATELPMQPSIVKSSDIFSGYEQVFIMSYPEGKMSVVDPESGELLQTVPVGSGPHEFLIMDNDLYHGFIVLNFGESTISFISEKDGSYTRIGRIGKPVTIGK